jgi:outer membrane protein TolC
MHVLIKLIHSLNGQIERVQHNLEKQATKKFQATCVAIALSLAGWGGIEPTQAKTLDREGIRASLNLVATNNTPREQPKFQTYPGRSLQARTPLRSAIASSTPQNAIAQVDNTRSNRLENNLNLPTTGSEIQITSNQSLTLEQALDIAYRNNRDIQVSRLNVERSQAAVNEAQAAKAITLGATATVQNQGAPLITNTGGGSTSTTSVQGGLGANYNILSSGRNDAQIRAAQEQVKFNQLDLDRVTLQLRSNVIAAYYDLQQADSAVIINQAAVTDATRSLSDAQLQEKAGVGTKFDILRAQVQLATANQNLVNAQGQQETARKRLAQLLSVNQNTQFKAADAVREAGTWNYSLEDSVVIAYKNRPELQQQLVQRNISKEQETVAAAANGAQVNLFANYNASQNLVAPAGFSTSLQDGYSIGAQLRWDFLDGGASNARSYQQKVSQEIAENQFTTTRNQVRFEVEQAYYSLQTNRRNIATATTALKQAEESLKLARLRFQAGVGTQTDVIQAQTELATARGNRVRAILDYNRSLSNLRTATVLK